MNPIRNLTPARIPSSVPQSAPNREAPKLRPMSSVDKPRLLLLSGGGWKGAFQVPILHRLPRESFDLVLGTSVGSINGIMYAQGDLPLLDRFWAELDDRSVLDGIKGFTRPALLHGQALFSLKPLRDELEATVTLPKLKVPYGCGIVVRETREHQIWTTSTARQLNHFVTTPNTFLGDKMLHDGIEASAAIAGIMEPVKHDPWTWCDGGHAYTIPVPEIRAPIGEIVVVDCRPLVPGYHPSEEVNGLADAFEWAFEGMMDAAHQRSLEKLRGYLQAGLVERVTVYAPPVSLGGMLAADRKTIQWRMELGRACVPIELE